uniref:Baculovirus repeated orf n=1 Tax=Lymantria dispar multicapsid nuclear polyhedrosis virus TaxID=10449 RepID=A0A6H0F084_NPVLD|nr:baculovirus repeated orf [Lymantria dispar multiple nucleopolyhedrovirus]WAK98386.1 ORF32 bro-a [Lymantria dispar multiple nucleopolyhedrovirus]WAK98535.1 ORF32 bro-a [Lymantria dispar multiple nucleopolyhedrovirus]
MALSKVNFVNGPLEVFTVQDDKQEKWMVANPFAEVLKYSRPHKAIQQHVSAENQKTLQELRSAYCTSSLHPQTKFINMNGVIELLLASQMQQAKEFRYWMTNVKFAETSADPLTEFIEWRAHNTDLLARNVNTTKNKDFGCVYVLTNALLQTVDAYKIGYTHDLHDRIAELNVASPLDFKPVFVYDTATPRRLEQQLHNYFLDKRIKREFYKLDKEDLLMLPVVCNKLNADA